MDVADGSKVPYQPGPTGVLRWFNSAPLAPMWATSSITTFRCVIVLGIFEPNMHPPREVHTRGVDEIGRERPLPIGAGRSSRAVTAQVTGAPSSWRRAAVPAASLTQEERPSRANRHVRTAPLLPVAALPGILGPVDGVLRSGHDSAHGTEHKDGERSEFVILATMGLDCGGGHDKGRRNKLDVLDHPKCRRSVQRRKHSLKALPRGWTGPPNRSARSTSGSPIPNLRRIQGGRRASLPPNVRSPTRPRPPTLTGFLDNARRQEAVIEESRGTARCSEPDDLEGAIRCGSRDGKGTG